MPGKLIVDEIEDSGGTSVIGRKNYIINGNFDIWQRGTSETGRTSSGYIADRWFINPSGGSVDSSRETFTVGQTDVPNNPEYFYRFENTVANDNVGLWQKIEGVETFAGQTITISFYAKYTTNKPTNLFIDINQDFGSGGSSDVSTSVFDDTNPYTTSWQKFTYTVTVPSISGKTIGTGDNIAIRFGNRTNETFDFDIAQVQVEVGSVATNFEVRPIGEELSLCQRYFELAGSGSIGRCTNTTSIQGIGGQWKVNKRTAPTLTLSDTSVEMGEIGVASRTSSGSSLSSFHAADEYGVGDIGLNGFSSLTSPNMVGMRQNFLNVDAEL